MRASYFISYFKWSFSCHCHPDFEMKPLWCIVYETYNNTHVPNKFFSIWTLTYFPSRFLSISLRTPQIRRYCIGKFPPENEVTQLHMYIIVLETIQCQLQMYRQYKCVYTYFEMWQILERKKIITHLVAFFYYNYKTIPVISHITEVGVCPPERIPNTTLCSSMTIYDMSTTCCLRTHKKESCSISLFTSWADIHRFHVYSQCSIHVKASFSTYVAPL